jgi:uncharacterized protein (TIGR04255 family)
MPLLANAPLVEVIFELRWGKIIRKGDEFQLSIPPEEELLPGQFKSIANTEGFGFYERINAGIPPLPHLVLHRYRPSADSWPCFQLGSGILTVNEVKKGYSWKSFRESVAKGLKFIDRAYPAGLEGLPGFGVELKYQDGFLLEAGETAEEFLRKKIRLGFNPPEKFFENANIIQGMKNNRISFSLSLSGPKGLLSISINQGLINEKPGLIMETTVRSASEDKPAFTKESLHTWLDRAHDIQKHTFRTLIDPKLHETFE